MESRHPILGKHISVEESTVDQEMKASPENGRRICNELVWELCKDIPSAITSDSILLTARNMYAYLAPGFSKKLVYRDAIAYLKAKLNAKESVQIRIKRMVPNNESEPIVVIRQKQWDYMDQTKFKLETNQFCVQIEAPRSDYQKEPCTISIRSKQFVNAHLLYFLRLTAPLLQPIQLHLNYNTSAIPIARLAHFLSTQSDWIDSIALWTHQLHSGPIYGTLNKCNKVQINDSIYPINVTKLVHWLTNNNGQPKKYLVLEENRFGAWLTLLLLIDEVKTEFARAKSKSRFVVCLELDEEPLDEFKEFTLCNELTGETLELRLKNIEVGRYIYALTRSPDNGLDDNENDYAELGTFRTQIRLH